MKRLSSLLVIIIALFGVIFSACSSSDDEPNPTTTNFKVTTTALSFLKSGGSQSVFVEAPTKPSALADVDWVRATSFELNGESSTIYKLVLTADANTTNEDRTATVTVSCGTSSATIAITQIAKDGIVIQSVTPDPSDLSYEATTLTVDFLCNVDYTAEAADSWVSVIDTRSRAAMTNHQVTLQVSANGSKQARQTTVTFTAGDATETITISQAANTSNNMSSNALELAKKIYAGWNIGNTLEATGGENAWGNPNITESYIQSVKAAGFNAIRLPVAWNSHLEDADTYKIKDEWLNRVHEVVNMCVANDLYVIVNIHWDGGWLENHCTTDYQEANNKKQRVLWTQIANDLNEFDEHLLFAGCNEPNASNETQMGVLRTYEQTFVDAVRATGGNNALRVLIVQGPNTDIDNTFDLFGEMPTDNVSDRLMVEVHYYSPWNFCGMEKDESWGKRFFFWGTGNHVADSDHNATWGEEDYVISEFDKMKQKFVDKGVPVILGEYGALMDWSNELKDNPIQLAAHKQSRYDWNKIITREAKNHGMVPFMWDTGAGIDRNTGALKDECIVPAAIEGAGLGNYPF
jgi:aryl-phospho-beta-D-glucosidase BglC (GH1 family)